MTDYNWHAREILIVMYVVITCAYTGCIAQCTRSRVTTFMGIGKHILYLQYISYLQLEYVC